MTITKAQIPEIPSWVTFNGSPTDNWFYQQLARFAGERNRTTNNVVISGQFNWVLGVCDTLTFAAKPVALISCCPANIGSGSSHMRFWGDNWTFILSYNSVGPVYQTVILTANTMSSTRTDNGDGTWTLDPNTYGYGNSSTNPDYYAVFLQT